MFYVHFLLYVDLKINTKQKYYVTATPVKGLLRLHPKLRDIIEPWPQTWMVQQ